jgi:glycine/D-amino acid oxidase-like deaminating enzyme
MLRMLQQTEVGERLRRSWLEWRDHYPRPIASQIIVVSAASQRFENICLHTDALMYEPVAAVSLPILLQRLRRWIAEQGVHFVDDSVERIERSGIWTVHLEKNEQLLAERVIFAAGAGLATLFPDLDLRRKGGELLVVDPGDQVLEKFVNADSHVFQRPDHLWSVGSTYFPVEEWNTRDDDRVVERLLRGASREVPVLRECEVVGLWRGVRCVFGSDHRPLVGEVPGQPGLFVIGALGSKGLLWAPFLARRLASNLLAGTSIPAEVIADRVSERLWRISASLERV